MLILGKFDLLGHMTQKFWGSVNVWICTRMVFCTPKEELSAPGSELHGTERGGGRVLGSAKYRGTHSCGSGRYGLALASPGILPPECHPAQQVPSERWCHACLFLVNIWAVSWG